jgi:hypothetical protein
MAMAIVMPLAPTLLAALRLAQRLIAIGYQFTLFWGLRILKGGLNG